MRHSFFTKLFLGNLLLIGIIFAVGGGLSYRQFNGIYLAENEHHQSVFARMTQSHMEDLWERSGPSVETIDRRCKEFAPGGRMRLTVIASDGRVLGDGQADPRRMANHKTTDRPEVIKALGGQVGQHVRRSETLGIEFRYLARPIRHEDRIVGVVRVAMPILTIIRHQNFIRSTLLWAALAAATAAVLLALLLSWIWYAPLRQITRTARTLASGDLSAKAAIAGSGELAQLAAALHEMRDSIGRKIHQIATQRQNLVAVVENLREGVIALDDDGQVLLMNQAAGELLAADASQATGRHLQAVVRIPEIVDTYNEAIAHGEAVARQIETEVRGRRCALDVGAAPLPETSAESPAALLVVRDVTHLVRMAAVKAEFVANASHELRTPLATIRAAVDSLAGIEPDEHEEMERITKILDRHTVRLEEMTKDLLSLHAVETTPRKPRTEKIALGALAEWVRESFAGLASEKGVGLSVHCPDPDVVLLSDNTLLELILQNLLDNAIKFTPVGGEVVCRLGADEHRVVLEVRDTGCGIAPEIQDRVFERFFQASPSRSRGPKLRGTGLGLAIVKHASERLGATVSLQSTPGEGTALIVTLPQR